MPTFDGEVAMTDAEKRVLILEELIRQHRKYRTSMNDFNMADQILWEILRSSNNDND